MLSRRYKPCRGDLTRLAVLFLLPAPARPAELRGVVRDAVGSAIADAEVRVLRESDRIVVARGLSDQAGRFAIADVPAGDFILRVWARGFRAAWVRPAAEVPSTLPVVTRRI